MKTDRPATMKCQSCGHEGCDPEDDFCYGCNHVVCLACAQREASTLTHNIEDHHEAKTIKSQELDSQEEGP